MSRKVHFELLGNLRQLGVPITLEGTIVGEALHFSVGIHQSSGELGEGEGELLIITGEGDDLVAVVLGRVVDEEGDTEDACRVTITVDEGYDEEGRQFGDVLDDVSSGFVVGVAEEVEDLVEMVDLSLCLFE